MNDNKKAIAILQFELNREKEKLDGLAEFESYHDISIIYQQGLVEGIEIAIETLGKNGIFIK